MRIRFHVARVNFWRDVKYNIYALIFLSFSTYYGIKINQTTKINSSKIKLFIITTFTIIFFLFTENVLHYNDSATLHRYSPINRNGLVHNMKRYFVIEFVDFFYAFFNYYQL